MSASVLIEAVEAESLARGGVVAPALGDVQVADVFDPTWLKLVRTQVAVDGVEGVAEGVRQRGPAAVMMRGSARAADARFSDR